MNIPHVSYRLIHAKMNLNHTEITGWISASDDFRRENEDKLAFDMYYDLEKENGESPLDFALRNGWAQFVYQMFCIDYIVANRDRHGWHHFLIRVCRCFFPHMEMKIR